jgi:glycosyltransferase involved in cell wall biosynthesis
MPKEWVVIQGASLRWGGDTRRRYIFETLVRRTDARTTGWSRSDIARAIGDSRPFWKGKPYLAAAEIVSDPAAEVIRASARPAAVDLHDEPIAAATALGLPPDPEAAKRQRAAWASNLNLFPALVVPTRAFAELFSLDPARTIVAPNGTDTVHVQPAPFPDAPVVGLASGAGPGRGIETLVAAARLVRTEVRDLRLALWLVGTSPGSQRYLEELKARLAPDAWILVGTASYRRLPRSLARAWALCIPHPADPYFDVALPIKLADAMAAGRPVVVTPRTETAAAVRRYDAGVVASGDRPEDLAKALLTVLTDRELATRLGANGRRAAETEFDWSVIGARLAETLLARFR